MSAETPGQPIDVSVVLICHNQEGTIAESLQSVISQTAFGRIRELIVVDDSSNDSSVDIVSQMALEEPKISVIRRESNSGGGAIPRNNGLARASGTYVAFLDGDDIWLPEKIEVQLDVLERHPEVGLLYCDFVAFNDATGEEQRVVCHHLTSADENQIEKLFIHGGPILPSCAVVAKAATDVVGGMNPALRFNEESEFWLRVMTCMPAHHLSRALVRKREWYGSIGSAKYGLENLQCKREITKMMVELVPRLAAVAPKREAEIELKTAVHYFGRGDTLSAREHLRRALALDRGLSKARLYLALSYLSSEPERLLDHVRKSRAWILKWMH